MQSTLKKLFKALKSIPTSSIESDSMNQKELLMWQDSILQNSDAV